MKDLLSQVDEEQTKVLSLTDSISKVNDKMRVYKAQIETAEASAAQGNYLDQLNKGKITNFSIFSLNSRSSTRTRA